MTFLSVKPALLGQALRLQPSHGKVSFGGVVAAA
jgi:hypothetical protein